MAKRNYDNWSKEELVKEVEKLEKKLKKNYGLVWEDKLEDVASLCKEKLPILTEDKKKEINTDKDKSTNILIEGDNYHALSVLNYTHKEKIDCIYIDPPYNTGNNDFKYNDRYVDLEDSYRHSKWISFMYRRLRLARNLLKANGVVFLSIGEEEVANLKILTDEIFGENNFLSYIARIAKTASNKGNYFAPSIDFVLVYAKYKSKLPLFKDEVNAGLYKKKDRNGFYRDDVALFQAALDIRPNQRYYIKCPDGSLVIPPGGVFPKKKEDGAFVKPETTKDKVWRWSYPSYFKKRDLLVFKETGRSPLLDQNGNQARWNIYTKSYLDERTKVGVAPRNFLDQFINRKGADFLKTIDVNFSYSKPVELIKHLIKITNKEKNIVVLDFMAGSGTTGQAVLELNKEDEGSRKFILCTNNENNICTKVCYPRIKKVIEGYRNNKGEKFDSLGGNLKYFKTDFVDAKPTDRNKKKLVDKSTEMLCLKEDCFDEVKKGKDFRIFNNTQGKCLGIIYDDDGIEPFKKEAKKMNKKFVVYVFSLDESAREEEFEDMADMVQLKPIPAVILNVYKRIFK